MSVEKILMPQLGESVTEGTINQWLVSVGTKVNKYDPLAEIITDKVTAEVPSSFTGIIKEIIAQEGETITVGEIICTIETEENSTEVEQMEVTDLQENSDTIRKRNPYSTKTTLFASSP